MHRAARCGRILRRRGTVCLWSPRVLWPSDVSEMHSERWNLEGERQYEMGVRKTGLEDI